MGSGGMRDEGEREGCLFTISNMIVVYIRGV